MVPPCQISLCPEDAPCPLGSGALCGDRIGPALTNEVLGGCYHPTASTNGQAGRMRAIEQTPSRAGSDAPRDPLENITRVAFVLELPRLCCRVPN